MPINSIPSSSNIVNIINPQQQAQNQVSQQELQKYDAEGQMQWCEKEIKAITDMPNLAYAQATNDIEGVLEKVQHVCVDLRWSNGEQLWNCQTVLARISNKEIRNTQSLSLKASGAFKDNFHVYYFEIKEVLEKNPQLNIVHLDFSDNKISPSFIEDLADLLSIRNISTLELSRNPLGNQGIKHLAEHFQSPSESKKTINTLKLDDTGIDKEGVMPLVAMLRAGLQELSIENHKISDDGVNQLLDVLSETSIKCINLKSAHLSETLKESLRKEYKGATNKEGESIRLIV